MRHNMKKSHSCFEPQRKLHCRVKQKITEVEHRENTKIQLVGVAEEETHLFFFCKQKFFVFFLEL